jgi:hypothetical protein
MSHEMRYPLEKLFFGIASSPSLPPFQGDDVYLPSSSMNEFYPDTFKSTIFQEKFKKSREQFDVSIESNNEMIVPSTSFVGVDRVQ